MKHDVPIIYSSARAGAAAAFTLIEMLVVIAIIGILAGMTVHFASRGMTQRQLTRVEMEREQIQLWIEDYKAKKGYYPLDNTNNDALPPLYYELAGAVIAAKPAGREYTTRDGRSRVVMSNELWQAFGVRGLLNASGNEADAASDAPCFMTNLRDNQLKPLKDQPNVYVLVAPQAGPEIPELEGNPWHYRSTTPIHNPKGFDLWAEVKIGGLLVTNGNWKK